MLVRDARPEDAATFEQVRVDGWHDAYREIVPPAFLAAFAVDPERVAWRERALRDPAPGHVTLVAEHDGALVGTAHLAPTDEGAAELLTLYVSPAAWGTGAGTALLVDGFVRMPQPEHVLWTFEQNARARAFYGRHGFVPDGGRRVLDLAGPVAEVRLRRAAPGPPT